MISDAEYEEMQQKPTFFFLLQKLQKARKEGKYDDDEYVYHLKKLRESLVSGAAYDDRSKKAALSKVDAALNADGDDFDDEIDGLTSGWFPQSFTTFPSPEELNTLQSSLGR